MVSLRLHAHNEAELPHLDHRESDAEEILLDKAGRKRRKKIVSSLNEAGSLASEHDLNEGQTVRRSSSASIQCNMLTSML